MERPAREKFATQMDRELLSDLRTLAKQEGRQIQALLEEAVIALLEDRRGDGARPHVMTAYRKSHTHYASVYEKLAK